MKLHKVEHLELIYVIFQKQTIKFTMENGFISYNRFLDHIEADEIKILNLRYKKDNFPPSKTEIAFFDLELLSEKHHILWNCAVDKDKDYF